MKRGKWLGLALMLLLVTGVLAGCRNRNNNGSTEGSTSGNYGSGTQESRTGESAYPSRSDEDGDGVTAGDRTYDATDNGLVGDISSGAHDLGEDISEGVSDAGRDISEGLSGGRDTTRTDTGYTKGTE